MNLRNLAKAFFLLDLLGMLAVPLVRADDPQAPFAPMSPPMTFERQDALESAASDPSLPSWQREIMREIAHGTGEPAMGSLSRNTEGLSQAHHGEWHGLLASGRTYHTSIYDPVRDQMVVFGGWGNYSVRRNDVWVLKLSGTPTWSPLSYVGGPPLGRHWHSAIYDPLRDRIVTFGGLTQCCQSNDVWALSLSGTPEWNLLASEGLPERYGHTAIYDPVRDRMVIFGGRNQFGTRNDVWALSLSGAPAWSALAPSGTPPPVRYGHTAVYDPIRDRMLVYGGNGGSGEVWMLTLAGDPAWSVLVPSGSTPSITEHTAIYDPVRDRMVVFGGKDISYPNTPRNDVWALTLSGSPYWLMVTPSGTPPPACAGHSALYDPIRDRMVVFGCGGVVFGGVGGGVSNYGSSNAWALTLTETTAWSLLSPRGRTALLGHAAFYDPVRDRMVVFGGERYPNLEVDEVSVLTLSDNPEWDTLVTAGTPPAARKFHSVIYDPVRDRMVVFGGRIHGGGAMNDVWELTLSGSPAWSELIPSGSLPSKRFSHTAIYDPVRDRMVMFGGISDSDVWALSLSGTPAWTQLSPSGTPPSGRAGHTAIYDPVRDRMIVFGGLDSTYHLTNDVWALTLSGSPAWSELVPSGSAPPEISSLSAIYDPLRDRMVVFRYDETWALELESPAWRMLQPSGPLPLGRTEHTAIYDPVRDRMVVFGGFTYSDCNDVWSLDWEHRVDDVPVSQPVRLLLHGARPNPVRTTAEVRYEISRDEPVRLEVLDIQGRVVRRLRQGLQTAGRHSEVFDRRDDRGRPLHAGVYLIQLRTRDQARTARIVVLP